MRCLFLFFFFCQSYITFAQSYATYVYNIKDGLPTGEIYNLAIDTFGCVWAYTGSGISRFNGREFINFDKNDDLFQGNNISDIFADKDGNVWVVVTNAYAPYALEAMIFRENKMQYVIHLSDSNNVAIGVHPYTGKVYLFDRKNSLKIYDSSLRAFSVPQNLDTPEFLQKEKVDIDIAPAYFSPGWTVIVKNENAATWRYYHWEKGRFTRIPFKEKIGIYGTWSYPIKLPDKSYFIRNDTAYYRLLSTGKLLPFDVSWDAKSTPRYSQLFTSAHTFQTTIHDGHFYGKVVEFSQDLPQGYAFRFSTPTPIYKWGAVVKSKDGTYWVATRNGLVRVFPYMYESLSGHGKQMPGDLHVACEDKWGNVWFGSYTDGFKWFDGMRIRNVPKPYQSLNEFLPGSFRDGTGNMFFSVQAGKNKGVFSMDGKGGIRELIPQACSFHFHNSKDEELGISLSTGFAILNLKNGLLGKTNLEMIGDKQRNLQLPKVTTSIKDRYGRWWLGHRATGLACAESSTGSFTNFLVKDKKSTCGFWSSCADSKGNIWFGTTKGLFLFGNRPDLDIANLDLAAALKEVGSATFGGQNVLALTLIENRFLLIGYQKGLCMLDIERFYATGGQEEVVHIFTAKEGFSGSSVEQNGFYPDSKGRIWIITEEGAFRFDPELFAWKKEKPRFHVSRLIAGNDPVYETSRKIRLKPEINDVKIVLNLPNDPALQDDIYFTYRLLPDGITNVIAHDSIISLSIASPGNYSVEVHAVKDGIISEPRIIRFGIPYYWYNNPIIRALGVVGFALILLVFLLRYYRQRAALAEQKAEIEKRRAEAETLLTATEKQKSEMARLQVGTIVSQLNPHFTMNALNTLQIISFENPVAVKITSRLASNIRMAFNNTRLAKPYHKIKDEIQMVDNYLYIQKVRFEDKLTYQLPQSEEIDTCGNYNVLLTQILIHCENAVEHGIRNQENGGEVRVLIKDEVDYWHITIEDEGIGRKKARELNSIGTQQGTKMLSDLQKIYNSHNVLAIRTEYEDDIYSNTDAVLFGTRVHIWMPKDYHFEIK